jgi:hypothetical protein
MLIKILIGFFIFLIGYQIFLALLDKNNLVEGLENETTTDPNSALILSQQNAGNIEVLKGRVDELDGAKGLKSRVDTMQQNIDSMQTQIDGLVQQQADYATDLAGDEPIVITGTEDEEEEE